MDYPDGTQLIDTGEQHEYSGERTYRPDGKIDGDPVEFTGIPMVDLKNNPNLKLLSLGANPWAQGEPFIWPSTVNQKGYVNTKVDNYFPEAHQENEVNFAQFGGMVQQLFKKTARIKKKQDGSKIVKAQTSMPNASTSVPIGPLQAAIPITFPVMRMDNTRVANFPMTQSEETEKVLPLQPKQQLSINNQNLYDRLFSFRETFEGFAPTLTDTKNTGDNNKTKVLGYGMSFYINDDGSTRPFRTNETITTEEAKEQIRRYDSIYAPKQIKENLGLKNFDSYPPELKFQILEAMFNMRGADSIKFKSSKDHSISNYYNELQQYEKNRGWENPDYDLNRIFKHADWNSSNPGWLGLRSYMRQVPLKINWDDVVGKDYYHSPNQYRDSLRNVYRPTF